MYADGKMEFLWFFLKRKKCHINTAEASFQIAGKQIVLAKY